MDIFESAFKLHTLGYSVIPSGMGKEGKSPLVSWVEFQKRKPTDQELEQWHSQLTPQLWGIVTGAISGLVVIDADNAEAKAILENDGLAPHIITPRGGGHFYFKHPGHPVKTRAGLLPRLDIRADGGFVNVVGKGQKGEYQILIMPSLDCLYPWEHMPQAILKAIQNNTKPFTPSTGTTKQISEGQRNTTMASLGGSMRRKGLPQEAIEAALLEVNRLQCQPSLSEEEVKNIARSVARYNPETDILDSNADIVDNTDILDSGADFLDNADNGDTIDNADIADTSKAGKIIAKSVVRWLSLHQGERFDLDTICRQLEIRGAENRHLVVKKLSYEISKGRIEKSVNVKPPIYSTLVNIVKPIDWLNASDTGVLTITWPRGRSDGSRFGFDGHVVVSPGDIIVVAGSSNAGKSTFALNFLWENMDNYPCTLMGNEYAAVKFKRRVKRMDWKNPLNKEGVPKFELIDRHEDWKSIIRPNNINIIDWISLGDNFYQIGSIIEGIQSKLRDGIAMIVLQKGEGKMLGLGGGFSEHLASFYLLVDFGRITVRKCKEWWEHDPNGEMYGFEIAGGGTCFQHIRKVKKCAWCRGQGVKFKGGQCEGCDGTGIVDV